MREKTKAHTNEDAGFHDWCVFQGHIDLLKAIVNGLPEAEYSNSHPINGSVPREHTGASHLQAELADSKVA